MGKSVVTRSLRWLRGLPLTFYLLPVVLFVVLPGTVARNNEIGVFELSFGAWLSMFLFAGFAVAALVVLRVLFALSGLRRPFDLLVRFACFLVVVAGMAFPLTEATGLVDPPDANVDTGNLAIAGTLAGLAVVASEGRWRRWLRLGLLLFVALNVGFTVLTSAIRAPEFPESDLLSVSDDLNLFVLSFDSLDGSVVNDVVDGDSVFRHALAGFRRYELAATSSPATSGSVVAELVGNQDFRSTAETGSEVWDQYSELLITNRLGAAGVAVRTYGQYSSHLSNGAAIMASEWEPDRVAALLRSGMARALSPALVPEGDLVRSVVDGISGSEQYRYSELARRISDSQAPPWATNLTLTILDLRRVLNGLSTGSDNPTAFFLHFTHTHSPVEFDDLCQFRGDDAAWFHSRQNFQGARAEARCAVSQFAAFIEKLKALGVFDSSLIVLKSDHGKPVPYAAPNSLGANQIRGHHLYGMARYMPFLAIKPVGADDDEPIRLARAPALIDDLARTICEELGVIENCAVYPGFNLIREEPIPPDDQVTAFVVSSAFSDFRFQTHEPIAFQRGEDVRLSMFEALISAGAIDE